MRWFSKKQFSLFLSVALICSVVVSWGSASAESNVYSNVYSYDSVVLADEPVGFWTLEPGVVTDATGNGHDGFFVGGPSVTAMPNGDGTTVFNGIDQYFEIPDHDQLELTTTGILTVEAWMRPDTLEFENQQSSGYVHWMGKGEPGQHSWTARMYSYTNTENRPNRISGYSFNLAGGLGAGSYFQDPVTAGEWIHYTLVINTVDVSEKYPTGYTKIFKNGVLRDQDALAGYNIIPGNGTAPIRIGTRDFGSFFEGAVGKAAIYNYELTSEQLLRHVNTMIHGPEVNEIVGLAGQVAALAELTAPAESDLEAAVEMYYAATEKLANLPADVFPDSLALLLSDTQTVIVEMTGRYLDALPPGNGNRLHVLVLEFLVDYAIQETGAQSMEDAGIVQGYVMSFVKQHATGKAVNEIIKQQLQ